MVRCDEDTPGKTHLDLRPIQIGRVRVHPVTLSDTLGFIENVIEDGQRAVVHYANAHAINLAEDDEEFRAAMREASLVFCDGKSLQWAARLLGHSLPERFTPPDWIDDLCSLAAARNWRVFFLGSAAGIAARAAEKLELLHPSLKIATAHGFFRRSTAEEREVIARIREYRPQILLIGLGMPTQELWARKHAPRLNANVLMTVGGMFDYVSGYKSRGPHWMTAMGLEWLTRLAREPKRLGARYLTGNPRFICNIARMIAKRRFVGTDDRC